MISACTPLNCSLPSLVRTYTNPCVQVCGIAAAAEGASEHPLARAVQEYAEQQLERLASSAATSTTGSGGYGASPRGAGRSGRQGGGSPLGSPRRQAQTTFSPGRLRVTDVQVNVGDFGMHCAQQM